MRIAILADVHANLPAFDAVLADIDALGADRIVVNGDLVNRGPSNVEAMDRLVEGGWPATLGNHDDLMRMWVERDPGSDLSASWFDDPFWRGTGWCADRLEAAGRIDAIRELPMTLRLEPPGAPTVLLSHGSPRHYREGYGRFLSESAFGEILRDHPADVLVGSHTHQPFVRTWRRTEGRRTEGPREGGRWREGRGAGEGRTVTVLNTGAVGAPFDGDPRAQYLLLDLEGGAWRPRFRRVPYDRERALLDFERSGYLAEGGLLAAIFREELLRARSYLTPFLLWSEATGAPRDERGWARYRVEAAERFPPPPAMPREAREEAGPTIGRAGAPRS